MVNGAGKTGRRKRPGEGLTPRIRRPAENLERDGSDVITAQAGIQGLGQGGGESDMHAAVSNLVVQGRLAVYWIPARAGMTVAKRRIHRHGRGLIGPSRDPVGVGLRCERNINARPRGDGGTPNPNSLAGASG
jgi:hypothetical protein